MSVALVVNVYERTYRDVLSPGYFSAVARSSLFEFDEVVALINNIDCLPDALDRAQNLLRSGEISSYAKVNEYLDSALAAAKLSHRHLRRRGFLLDYGLVMPFVTRADWLLGWDAETRLVTPHSWIPEAIAMMEGDPRVFHTSLNWRAIGPNDRGVGGETVLESGPYSLNWGFSDQLFLLRRENLSGPIYRSFAPAAIVRHAPHPYTFEYRVEAHQRATGRFRATLLGTFYDTNHIPGGVLRNDKTRLDGLQYRALRRFEHTVVDRMVPPIGPRYRKS